MNSKQKGITLVELIIVITVIAIIIIPFSNAFRATLTIWKTGSKSLELSKNTHVYSTTLKEKLHYIKSVNLLSLNSNNNGFINYTDSFDQTFLIFLNSTQNQATFNLNNDLDPHNIVISYVETSPTVELLIPNATYFNLESYVEDPTLAFKVISANNVTSPNYDAINSIKFIIKVESNSLSDTIEHIVDLSKTPIKDTGTTTFGTQDQLFQNINNNSTAIQTPFNDFLSDGDIIRLEQSSFTVTIQHSGNYYSTITDALNNAKAGDTVLVGYSPDGYNENLNIPAGISLKGGYNPITWERNLATYPTNINTKEGLTISAGVTSVIFLNENSTIDGFNIDARTLDIAIYAKDTQNISIRNTTITNCDIGIYLDTVSGDIIQNNITANKNTLSINNATTLLISRNNLQSNNFAQKANVSIQTATDLNIVNNLISNGYSGMDITNLTNSFIAHNAFTKAQNFALDLTNLNSCQLNNNIISENNLGIIVSSSSPGNLTNQDLNNNFFANNKFGDSINFNLNASNISVSLSDIQWENSNPYFSSTTAFTLLNDSPLIDAGLGSQETYTSSNPSKGTQTNDIGIYGGSNAGRIGIGNQISITADLTNSAITTRITNSFPGDIIVFSTGDFNISTPIQLKPYQYLGGTNSRTTKLNHLTASTLINVTNENYLEHFYINANTNTAISIVDSLKQHLTNLIIVNASTAISLQNSVATIRNITFYECTTGVKFNNNTSGDIAFSIFDSLNLGIENTSTTFVVSTRNIFANTNTLYSGNILNTTDYADTMSNLRNPTQDIFELKPTANAINFYNHTDAGSIEYYIYEGVFSTTPITSKIDRYYKNLSLTFLTNQSQPTSLSEIEIEFLNNNKTYTLADIILLDSETITSKNISLPLSIIADDFTLNIYLKSYSFNSTPFIDSLTLSW
jgi:competence protein ComGC